MRSINSFPKRSELAGKHGRARSFTGSAASLTHYTSPSSFEVHLEGKNLIVCLGPRINLRWLCGPYSGISDPPSVAGCDNSLEEAVLLRVVCYAFSGHGSHPHCRKVSRIFICY